MSEGIVKSLFNNSSQIRSGSLSPRLTESEYLRERIDMVDHQIRSRGITDPKVLAAMAKVPRHLFAPPDLAESAYDDRPLPIGFEQTISQPYIVALMTSVVQPTQGDRVLEIGTGCGYQTAVLAELVSEVYSIEIIEELASQARGLLADLGYENIFVRRADGYNGWVEKSPFDIILVAAAPAFVPQPLIDQLAPGGRLVIPVGRSLQHLVLIERDSDGRLKESRIAPVRFVPMTGEAGTD